MIGIGSATGEHGTDANTEPPPESKRRKRLNMLAATYEVGG
jgi:hypothetical protein